MKNVLITGGLLLLAGCAVAPASSEDQSADNVATTTEALNVNKITAWQALPQANLALWPAIISSYSSSYRYWNVCSVTTVQTIVCNMRQVIFGTDYGWSGWTPLNPAPPAGVTFGPNGSPPALAQWLDNYGVSNGAVAARQATGSSPGSIWMLVQQHAGPSTWYLVPDSGQDAGFTATSNFSLAAASGYLYIVASKCSGSTCTAFFTRNYVAAGYSNTGWSPWVADSGYGVFNAPVYASAAPNAGSLIVSGIGTDNNAYISEIVNSNWQGGWSWDGGVFYDSPTPTTFSSYAGDVELFGLGTNYQQWEGSLNSDRTQFDGYYQMSSGGFFTRSPAAYAPAPNIITLATSGWDFETGAVTDYVADYTGP